MVALPKRPEQKLIDDVYTAIKAQEPGLRLSRIGSSSIGGECMRAIWLSWRAYDKSEFDGRMLRLFETGHLQESRIVADIKRAGYTVYDVDDNGDQFSATLADGHFVTKIDGVISGVYGYEKKPHLLEIKTHNKNSFSGVVKHGVAKHKPAHYAQVQISMALMNLKRTMYVAVCKDDEQFYVERIKEDKPEQERLKKRIISIRDATLKPAGISEDKNSFGCKFCDVKDVCYGDKEPLKTCRSCRNVVVANEGGWVCSLTGETLSQEAQLAACGEYNLL